MSGTRRSAAGRLSILPFLLAACDPGVVPTGTDPSPALLLQDSVELREPSSGALGLPGALLVEGDGGYLVTDLLASRVVEYDATGNPRREIGRKGSGPGEHQMIIAVALDGDSVLYVLDSGTMLHVWDFRTGEYRQRARVPATWSVSIAAQDERLYFRSLDSARTPRMSAWEGGEIIEGPALPAVSELEAVKATGAAEVARMANTTHSWAAFAPLGDDRIAVLSQSSEDVLVATLGRVINRIPVARTQRRGVSPDVLARLVADPNVTRDDPQLAYAPSVPVAVGRNDAGHFISVKADHAFEADHLSAKLWLSVTDPRSGLTCPDARVPVPEDPMPFAALRGGHAVGALARDPGSGGDPRRAEVPRPDLRVPVDWAGPDLLTPTGELVQLLCTIHRRSRAHQDQLQPRPAEPRLALGRGRGLAGACRHPPARARGHGASSGR